MATEQHCSTADQGTWGQPLTSPTGPFRCQEHGRSLERPHPHLFTVKVHEIPERPAAYL